MERIIIEKQLQYFDTKFGFIYYRYSCGFFCLPKVQYGGGDQNKLLYLQLDYSR